MSKQEVHTRINPNDDTVMIFLPSGESLMGDDLRDNSRYTVKLSGYWIYKNPVTPPSTTNRCTMHQCIVDMRTWMVTGILALLILLPSFPAKGRHSIGLEQIALAQVQPQSAPLSQLQEGRETRERLARYDEIEIQNDLIDLLVSNNQSERQIAGLYELCRLGDPRPKDTTLAMLRSSSAQMRIVAVDVLGMLREHDAAKKVSSLLKDPDSRVRQQAALALSRMGDKTGIESIRAFLTEKDHPDVLEAAAIALGRLKDQTAGPALLDLLTNPNASVRIAAARALSRMPNDESIRILRVRLAEEHDPLVRSAMAFALANYGEKLGMDALSLALSDKDKEVRMQAAVYLGRAGVASQVGALQRLMNDTNEERSVRQKAVDGLSVMGGTQARDVLIAALKSPDTDSILRHKIVLSISVINDPLVLKALLEAMQSPDPDLRATVALSLRRLKHQQVIDILRKAMRDDKDDDVRAVAMRSLATLGDLEARKLAKVYIDNNMVH